MRQVFKRSSLNKLYWKLEVVPIVIVLIALCGWIAYRHRPLPVSHSAMPRAIPAKLQLPPSPTIEKPPKIQREGKNNDRKSAFKRKRVGENEIDYVTDDVTIRQFGPASALKEHQSRNRQVGMRQKSERDGALDRSPGR